MKFRLPTASKKAKYEVCRRDAYSSSKVADDVLDKSFALEIIVSVGITLKIPGFAFFISLRPI